MILTYKEAQEELGSRHYVRKALLNEELFSIGRNLYSTKRGTNLLAEIVKLYPSAIITGQTAYYFYGLTDVVPDVIDLATKRPSTRITNINIRQLFISPVWLNTGKIIEVHDGVALAIYDLERMLLELARNRNKMSYDVYKEIVAAYRKRSSTIDIYKLQDYATIISRGNSYLEIIMKEVF